MRAPPEEALPIRYVQTAYQGQLLLRLDAFGNNLRAQRIYQPSETSQ